MSINHDDEFHGDINYGNRFPEGWYESNHITFRQVSNKKSMNVYPPELYSEVLKYTSERNEFFPS